MKKPEYNAFLTYWPWLLPIGLALGTAGLVLQHFGVLSDYWSGFLLGCGSFLALVGAGMLIARLARKNAQK